MIEGSKEKQFNGKRLKIARLYRNLSVSDLAEKIGVKKQAVSQFEIGETKPRIETELAIIRELGFPRKFFIQDVLIPEVNNTFFRALSSTTALDKKTQEVKTQMIVQIYNFLCEYLDLPCLNLPKFDLSNTDIENITMELRGGRALPDPCRLWHMGPGGTGS